MIENSIQKYTQEGKKQSTYMNPGYDNKEVVRVAM